MRRVFGSEPDSEREVCSRSNRMWGGIITPSMPLATGYRLGPYEITVLLGAGGMGEVYSARDTRLDRTVALKILPLHRSDQAEARERFEREARAIAALNHPNICQLYDVGSQDGVNYLVLEYLQGETLADRLAEVRFRSANWCAARSKSPMHWMPPTGGALCTAT